jgi:hypothetical protein
LRVREDFFFLIVLLTCRMRARHTLTYYTHYTHYTLNTRHDTHRHRQKLFVQTDRRRPATSYVSAMYTPNATPTRIESTTTHGTSPAVPPSDDDDDVRVAEFQHHWIARLERRIVSQTTAVSSSASGSSASGAIASTTLQYRQFTSRVPPPISPRNYLTRICEFTDISYNALVLASVYVDVALSSCHFQLPHSPLTILSVHRLVLTACLIASKFHDGADDDRVSNNRWWATVGGVAVVDLNVLEVAFLSHFLSYDAYVSPATYARARQLVAAASTSTTTPTTSTTPKTSAALPAAAAAADDDDDGDDDGPCVVCDECLECDDDAIDNACDECDDNDARNTAAAAAATDDIRAADVKCVKRKRSYYVDDRSYVDVVAFTTAVSSTPHRAVC